MPLFGPKMSSNSRESLDPSLFFSLIIKTVTSKVLIPVSISRLNISESRFQYRYRTQISKVLIPVLKSRLNYQKYQFYSQCPDLTLEFSTFARTLMLALQSKNTRKCKFTNLLNPHVQQNCRNFWANFVIWCPVRCWISFNLKGIDIFTKSTISYPLSV